MNSRKVITTVFYARNCKNYLESPIITFTVGSHCFQILHHYIDLKDIGKKCPYEGISMPYWYLVYCQKNKSFVLNTTIYGRGGYFKSTEAFSEEEGAIILAKLEQITKCAKEGKEYSSTEALEELKMSSRKVKVTVSYTGTDKYGLKCPSITFTVGSHSFEILQPYIYDGKDIGQKKCLYEAVGNSCWRLDYCQKNKSFVLNSSIHGTRGYFQAAETFSEEESAIILAEMEQITKYAKEGKEYSPATEDLEYDVVYDKYT